MTHLSLTFDAVSEATPGPKWAARWARLWPAYEAWFMARGGDNGPPPAKPATPPCNAIYRSWWIYTPPFCALPAGPTAQRGSSLYGVRPAILAAVRWPVLYRKRIFGWCVIMISDLTSTKACF